MPTELERAALSKKRGQASAQISDPEAKKKFIAAQGDAEKKDKSPESFQRLDRDADDTLATGGANKDSGARSAVPPTFRRGGRVKRTGMAKVHKGEVVLTASQSALGAGATDKKAAKKAAKAAKKAAKKKAKGK